MRNVGDMNPEFPQGIVDLLKAKGVVEVAGICGVNSDDIMLAAVGAALAVQFRDVFAILSYFLKNLAREL